MPRRRFSPLLLLLLASCRTEPSPEARTAPKGPGYRYDVERGVVEYALDGMERGTETVRFKDFGRHEVKRKKFEVDLGIDLGAANEGPQEVVAIIDGTTIVNYDPVQRMGTRTLNSLERLGGEEKFKGKSMVEVTKGMYVSMGGRVVGTKTIAGQSCEVWKIEKLGTETCIHRGVSLEVTTIVAGMKQHSVAVKVDWNATVDDAEFVVPKDVTLGETDLAQVKRSQEGAPAASPSAAMSPDDALRLLRESAPTK